MRVRRSAGRPNDERQVGTPSDEGIRRESRYRAFISYSHGDENFSPALKDALLRLAKPWYRSPLFKVFLDETSIPAGSDLEAYLKQALSDSDFLILVASKLAANSEWVSEEVSYWCRHKSPDSLLIALRDGEIEWSRDAGDFDWSQTTALPSTALRNVLTHEPTWVDFKQIDTARDLDLDNPAFRGKVAALAAPLHGVDSHEELINEHQLQHRRLKLWRRAAITTVAVLALLASGAALVAFDQRNQAEAERNVAVARQLAAQAELVRNQRPDLLQQGALLAVESLSRVSSQEGEQSLRRALQLLPRVITEVARGSPVQDADISSDGTRIVTADFDGTAQAWDAATGEPLGGVQHAGAITQALFVDEGRLVVSGGRDREVLVWNADTGAALITKRFPAPVTTFDANSAALVATAVENEGNFLASSRISVWNARSGTEVLAASYDGLADELVFDPTGRYLAVGGTADTVIVWDVVSGRQVWDFEHEGYTTSVSFSGDGRFVATAATNDSVQVYDMRTGHRVARMTHESPVGSMAFSENGSRLATGSWDGVLRVWHTSKEQEISRMTHAADVTVLALSPDGSRVVSGSDDGTARAWEVASGWELGRMIHEGPVSAIQFAPNGEQILSASRVGLQRSARLWSVVKIPEVVRVSHDLTVAEAEFDLQGDHFFTASFDGTAGMWDAQTGEQLLRLSHDDLVYDVAVSPSGDVIATAGADGTARLWDSSGAELHRIEHDFEVTQAAFGGDGRYLLTASEDTLSVWDVRSGERISEMAHKYEVVGFAVDPKGDVVVTANYAQGADAALTDDRLRVWNLRSGELVRAIDALGYENALDISPNGDLLAAGGSEGGRVYELSTGTPIASLAAEDAIGVLAFSSDGRYVVTGSIEGEVRTVEAETGREVARMTHGAEVTDVEFSPDGGSVASVSRDGTAQLWDAFTGERLSRISHEQEVGNVAFSADANLLVTTSGEAAHVWRIAAENLIETACSRVTRNLTREEWRRYNIPAPYEATCPNLPTP